jgi:hypothetical protein
MKKVFYLLTFVTVVVIASSCHKVDTPLKKTMLDGNVAFDWYRLQLRFLLERNSTMNGVYFAYLGIGLYESVHHGIENSVSLSSALYQMPAMPTIENGKLYQWESSGNAAMAAMLRSFNAGLTTANLASIDSLENAYNDKFVYKPGDPIFTRSQAFGKSIAAAIFSWSKTDNFNPGNNGYVPPVFAGAWEPTPPGLVNPPLNPYISSARPLLSSDADFVALPFPTSYSEEPGSDFYNIAKYVYDVSHTLTPDQKNIALFWADQGNGLGYTPDGHNQFVVTQALEQAKANLEVAAETYAKAGIAERESSIECFRAKYKYTLLRPVSYIRKVIDGTWLPLIVTPPFPEYPNAHAYVTSAVMRASANVLGDKASVTDHSYDFRGWAPRIYPTLDSAGREAGISRVYGGIHYVPSTNTAITLGKDLGNRIGSIKLHGIAY